eukprot:CAMPEP_0176317948 /NCGR_PEP_ID=MMETSP0121_2-20121125/69521_1 /TAXON_ID=160619 /ORGANISM="Kryptoperidinium foliaceum, Strain CCMP 1326" /LENGTH=73 /DNA_ID=CAMNT_0017660225 /DNA_START=1 /DNA_END=219 /DNA_ORIENTATION=+
MPWLHGLAAMSREQLRRMLQDAGARRAPWGNRKYLVTNILRSASADSALPRHDGDIDVAVLRRLLEQAVPQDQ